MSNFTQQPALAALNSNNQLATLRGMQIGYLPASALNLNVSAAMYNAALQRQLAVAQPAAQLRRAATFQSPHNQHYSQSQSSTPKLRNKTYCNNVSAHRNANKRLECCEQPNGRPNSNAGQSLEKACANVDACAASLELVQLSRAHSSRSSRSSTASSPDGPNNLTNTVSSSATTTTAAASATAAHHLEHFVEVNGERISKTNVYIRGLQADTSDDDLRRLCSEFGEIVSVRAVRDEHTRTCRGFGFVDFRHAADAQLAESELSKRGYCASLARVQHADETNLYLQNLPSHVRETQLAALCGRFGTVVSTCVLRDLSTGASKRVGFVRMRSKSECENVIRAVHLHSWSALSNDLPATESDVQSQEQHSNITSNVDDSDTRSHKETSAGLGDDQQTSGDSRSVLLVKYADDPLAKRQKRQRANTNAANTSGSHSSNSARTASTSQQPSTSGSLASVPQSQSNALVAVPQSAASNNLAGLFAKSTVSSSYYPQLNAYYRQAAQAQLLLNANPLYAAALQSSIALARSAPVNTLLAATNEQLSSNSAVSSVATAPIVQTQLAPSTVLGQPNAFTSLVQQYPVAPNGYQQTNNLQQSATASYTTPHNTQVIGFQQSAVTNTQQPADLSSHSQAPSQHLAYLSQSTQPCTVQMFAQDELLSSRTSATANSVESRASQPRTVNAQVPVQQNAVQTARNAHARLASRNNVARTNAQNGHGHQAASAQRASADDSVKRAQANSYVNLQNNQPTTVTVTNSQPVVQSARASVSFVQNNVNAQAAQNTQSYQNAVASQSTPVLIPNVSVSAHAYQSNNASVASMPNAVYLHSDSNYYQYPVAVAGHDPSQCDYVVFSQQPSQQQHPIPLHQSMTTQGTQFLNGQLVRVGPDPHNYAVNVNVLSQPQSTVYVNSVPQASSTAPLHAAQPYTMSVQQTAVAQNGALQSNTAVQSNAQQLIHGTTQNGYPIAIGYTQPYAHYATTSQTGYFFQPTNNVQLR